MAITYLYRLLDDHGRLLYIGISHSPIHRLFQHLEDKPWAPQISWQKVMRFETRDEALQAERQAIETETPLYNIQFNDNRSDWPDEARYSTPARRSELFQRFKENAVPKDHNLSTSNARLLARQLCGQIPNFTKSDWEAWCDEPDDPSGVDLVIKELGAPPVNKSERFCLRHVMCDRYHRAGVPTDTSVGVRQAAEMMRQAGESFAKDWNTVWSLTTYQECAILKRAAE